MVLNCLRMICLISSMENRKLFGRIVDCWLGGCDVDVIKKREGTERVVYIVQYGPYMNGIRGAFLRLLLKEAKNLLYTCSSTLLVQYTSISLFYFHALCQLQVRLRGVAAYNSERNRFQIALIVMNKYLKLHVL
jgi:hypothetical protein